METAIGNQYHAEYVKSVIKCFCIIVISEWTTEDVIKMDFL